MAELWEQDRKLAQRQRAPRVSLPDIEANIAARYDVNGSQATGLGPGVRTLSTLSLCILVLRNGYMVVGKSAPASSENFDAEVGRQLAYEDALRQCRPLMGYALRERLHQQMQTQVAAAAALEWGDD